MDGHTLSLRDALPVLRDAMAADDLMHLLPTGFDPAGFTADDTAAQLHDRPGHPVSVRLATAQFAGHPCTACTPAFFTIGRLARLRSNRRADLRVIQEHTCHIPRPAIEPHATCIATS